LYGAAGSPTHFVKKMLGVPVALVPLGLLDIWAYEGRACFPGGNHAKISVVKVHGGGTFTGTIALFLHFYMLVDCAQ